jgi:hypothetical protein
MSINANATSIRMGNDPDYLNTPSPLTPLTPGFLTSQRRGMTPPTTPARHVHTTLHPASLGSSVVLMTGYPGFLASGLAERLLKEEDDEEEKHVHLHCIVQRQFLELATVLWWCLVVVAWEAPLPSPEQAVARLRSA